MDKSMFETAMSIQLNFRFDETFPLNQLPEGIRFFSQVRESNPARPSLPPRNVRNTEQPQMRMRKTRKVPFRRWEKQFYSKIGSHTFHPAGLRTQLAKAGFGLKEGLLFERVDKGGWYSLLGFTLAKGILPEEEAPKSVEVCLIGCMNQWWKQVSVTSRARDDGLVMRMLFNHKAGAPANDVELTENDLGMQVVTV